jgi:hypothetical protein
MGFTGMMDIVLPKKASVRDTGTRKGRGVFALCDIDAGEIVEVAPVILLQSSYEKLPGDCRKLVFNWKQIGGDRPVMALGLGWSSLYNSSNPSNLIYQASVDHCAIIFTAVIAIRKGEELTINYDAEGGAEYSKKRHWFEREGIEPIG